MPAIATPPRIAILVAVDETPASEDALRTAASLCAMLGSQADLHLVNIVVPVAPPDAAAFTPVAMGPSLSEAVKEAHVMLVAFSVRAGAVFKGRISAHVAIGSPAREIVQLASDLTADVIVVGTHNRKTVERWLLGSVSEQVLRDASCSVIVARPKNYPAAPTIEPPCPDCVATRAATGGATIWCEHHAEHHVRGRTHYELARPFAVGSMLLRPEG